MFEQIVRRLIEEKLVSVEEIEQLTGRSTSTVYRWVRGESEPPYSDIHVLIRKLANSDAQRRLLGLLTHDLPVVVDWKHNVQSGDGEGDAATPLGDGEGLALLNRSLQALRCVSDALAEEMQILVGRQLTTDKHVHLAELMDEGIENLMIAKQMLSRYVQRRKKAR